MKGNQGNLFSEAELFDFLRAREQEIRNEIDRFSSDYVLKVAFADLTEHLADKYRVEPVTLMLDQIHIGESGDTKHGMLPLFLIG